MTDHELYNNVDQEGLIDIIRSLEAEVKELQEKYETAQKRVDRLEHANKPHTKRRCQ